MKGYYSHLLNSFTLCARNSKIDVNFAAHGTFNYCFPSKNGHNHLRTLRPLHLRGCKPRSGGVVDVIVSFSENLDSKDHRITVQSRVAVAYFRVDLNNNNAALLLGIHYDFEPCDIHNEPWQGHPRFHAQISSDIISPQEIQLVSDTFSYQYPQPAPLSQTSEIVRIPTAHMCLASVLVSLAADFFKAEDFKEFLSKVREYSKEFPKPKTKEILENISADGHSLRSCAWYHRDPRTPATKPTAKRRRNYLRE